MATLIEMKEAAALLGVTPEELNDMRSRSEIFGYRDGASWKFKMEEIERVAEERGTSLGGASDEGELSLADDDDDLRDNTVNMDFDEFMGNTNADEQAASEEPSVDDDLDSDLDDQSESILVSEEELGSSERNTSSTIIGKMDDASSAGDSDLRLADDQPAPSPESSDIQLSADDDDDDADNPSPEMSDLNLAANDDDDSILGMPDSGIGSASDIGLSDSSGSDIGASDIGLAGGSDIDLDSSDLGLAGSSILGGGSGKASGSDLSLDEDDDEALELASDDDELELGEGSALSLDDDDGELVLDGGSDVSLAGDSGINLAMPADSGLSLEDEPMELSGSGISSLELPEDDDEDMVISLEEEADPDEATMVKGDNDFMLSPVDEGDDDPSDSGSQVIALDTEELDAEAATMLGASAGGNALALDDAEEEPAFQAEPVGAGAPATAAGYAGAGMVPAEPPEASYSIWQVLSLFIVVLMLAVSGMLMMDVIRNMWSFDQPYAANTSIMNMILDAVGKSK